MNVWYLSAYDQPKGLSSRTYDYSRQLVERGHCVTMFTNSYCHWTHVEHLNPGEKWRVEEIDGIRVVWLRTTPYIGNGLRRGLNMLANALRCIQASKVLGEKPDVVVGPSVPLGTGWAASRIAKAKDAAFVFEVRDVWPIALVENGGLSKKNPVYYAFRSIEKHLYQKANAISSALPFIHSHVSQSGGDPGKVTWMPNGIDFARYPVVASYSCGEKAAPVVMYVGGFGAEHDVLTIMKSAKILRDNGTTGLRFILVGDGVKRSECQRFAAAHGLSNIVEFRNPIPKTDVPKLLMESDILIACLIDSAVYRFGINLNKLYDYLAAARPIIFAGRAPNNPVMESGAGFSVPPEDPDEIAAALEKMLQMSVEERRAMGNRGRLYAEREFDMRKLGGRMESLLLSSIKHKSD